MARIRGKDEGASSRRLGRGSRDGERGTEAADGASEQEAAGEACPGEREWARGEAGGPRRWRWVRQRPVGHLGDTHLFQLLSFSLSPTQPDTRWGPNCRPFCFSRLMLGSIERFLICGDASRSSGPHLRRFSCFSAFKMLGRCYGRLLEDV